MNKGMIVAAMVAAVATSCATTPQVAYVPPQVTIRGGDTDAIKMRLTQRCVTGGGVVESVTDYQLVCAKPMDGSFGSLMFRALATPQYATNPDHKMRFTFAQNGNDVFVSVDMYTEYQTAFGQVNRMPMTNGNIAAQVQTGLNNLKAEVEGPGPKAAGTEVPVTPSGEGCKSCKTIGLD